MYEETKEKIFIICAIILILVIGLVVGIATGMSMEEKKAVKAGAAYYTNNVDGESVFKYKSNFE